MNFLIGSVTYNQECLEGDSVSSLTPLHRVSSLPCVIGLTVIFLNSILLMITLHAHMGGQDAYWDDCLGFSWLHTVSPHSKSPDLQSSELS